MKLLTFRSERDAALRLPKLFSVGEEGSVHDSTPLSKALTFGVIVGGLLVAVNSSTKPHRGAVEVTRVAPPR